MAKKKEIEKITFPERYQVLGADLSLRRPGFCLLDIEQRVDGTKILEVKLASVDNKTDKKKSHGQLLDEVLDCFYETLPMFLGAVEVFLVRENEIMKVKVPSERSLSKVVGVMDLAAYRLNDLQWHSIYPVTIKKMITGSGKATKEEVAEGLERYLGKQNYKYDDESDAAAVAVAWLIQQGQLKE